MRGAEAIKQTLPDSLLEIPVMNRFFESFLSVELHVLLRFGRWQDILARPIPTNDKVRALLVYSSDYYGIYYYVLCLLFVSFLGC